MREGLLAVLLALLACVGTDAQVQMNPSRPRIAAPRHPAQFPASLNVGIVAHWRMEEATGNRIDSVGGVALVPSGDPTGDTGKIGDAAKLVGASTQFLQSAAESTLEFGDTDFAIGAWVYMDRVIGDPQIIAGKWWTDHARSYYISYSTSAARFRFALSSDGELGAPGTVDCDALGAASATTWYLAVGTYAAATDTMCFWVNLKKTCASHSGGAFVSGRPLNVGSYNEGLANYFDGRIDELILWNRIPSDAELATLYNSGLGRSRPF